MNENTNVWFGVPKSDVTISSAMNVSSNDLEKVLASVKKDSRVKSFIYGNMFLDGVVNLDTQKYKLKTSLYGTIAMSSYKHKFGFTIVEGRNPENPKEVAVSLNILKGSGLSVGDYIELAVNKKKAEYLISGSYNSMMSNGYSIRLLSADIKKVLPKFMYSEIYVNLKPGVNKKEFKKYINNKYSNLDASDIHPMLKYTIESIPGTLLPISYLLMVVFIAFSSITILNIIIMNIRDNRRNFGIMKSLGFTSKEITLRYLYRVLISTIFSIMLAVAFNLTAARPLITFVINKIDVLIISPITMVSLLVGMTALIIIIILACCTAIRKAKPTELMEE
jgi:putative ABC transport system permease protein